ncbi:DUF262 domain-containing protein [Bacteroides sp.]|uniref:DUF262 domain-containing protein n=1 Tax=Bacteroides sp. TaxID=29523 RepID=UPI00261B0732|nr:DUF262 domain-containing HNH endonuclease family protein [Bacteroides sp.]
MKYTPKQIVEEKLFFIIPIYQRLFEWNPENILTLLHDLKRTFELSQSPDDYYIGMLTATESHELVDGQQRFTAMMLLGCTLKDYDCWSSFISSNETPRLKFVARPADDNYLQHLIYNDDNNVKSYVNLKMEAGTKAIKSFFENLNGQTESQRFAEYIFEHLSFFISELPNGYSPQDLNKYFERMNCSGKNLEQHEILKVKLLTNMPEEINLYLQLWNVIADVDTPLIRKSKENDDVKARKHQAFQSSLNEIIHQNIINGLGDLEEDESKLILDIPPTMASPKATRTTDRESRCSLRFPYLLLHTLYWKYKNIINESKEEFFNPGNLLEIFSKYLPYEGDKVNIEDISDFIDKLFRSRLIMDICFIRPTEYGYDLDMNLPEDNEERKKLLMLESMLYVSSSNFTNYKWFGWLMDYILPHNQIPNAHDLYEELKRMDDKEHELPSYESLSYGSDIRYWFWRLDLYVWLHRKEIFADSPSELEVTNKYVFIRNRSLEHIAPQTPQSDSNTKWEDTEEDSALRDSFGNLVMISQGLNSSLQNESYEVKRAHVEAYCNGSKTGSIESLKLLIVYQSHKNNWDKMAIRIHGIKMYELLKKSLE